jgi:hypothetical protein
MMVSVGSSAIASRAEQYSLLAENTECTMANGDISTELTKFSSAAFSAGVLLSDACVVVTLPPCFSFIFIAYVYWTSLSVDQTRPATRT